MNKLEAFRQVRAFVFDVDGVMTNSELIVTESGDLLRKMSVRDGYAIKRAIRYDWPVCIITGGTSKGVEERLRRLGVQNIFSGIQDKGPVLDNFIQSINLKAEEVLYLGDDLPDYEIMKTVGFPCCPSDAAPEIKAISKYISPQIGGAGCVRDVIEKVLKLNDQWV